VDGLLVGFFLFFFSRWGKVRKQLRKVRDVVISGTLKAEMERIA